MKQNWFSYDGSLMKSVCKEIESGMRKNRIKAARHIKNKIKKKATDIKVTGNLARGVYMSNGKGNVSFVGIHAPGFQNYLLEFGTSKMKPHPIVYPTFEEEANAVEAILSEQVIG